MEKIESKPLLILDLDETLIFGSEDRLHREADFRVGPFFLYKRPFLDQFLKSVSRRLMWRSGRQPRRIM